MDALFNMHKVKFSRMGELLGKYRSDVSAGTEVNFFINLEPIFRKITSTNIDDYLKVNTEKKNYELMSNIINLAAHYRLFFTKAKLPSKIYFYIGFPFDTRFASKQLFSEYRDSYYDKFVRETKGKVFANSVSSIIEPTRMIMEHIEDVFFLTSDYIEPSMIPFILSEDFKPNSLNIILTTDRFEYQYVNYGFDILRSKKKDSYYVTKENVIEVMKIEEKISNKETVSSNFIPFILSFIGDSYRNLPKIKRTGLSTLINLLNSALENGIITNNTTNIQLLENIVADNIVEQVRTNYSCIDIKYQMGFIPNSAKVRLKDQMVNKFDLYSLKKINEDFFHECPLMLLELAQYSNKKKPNVFGI